MKKLAVLVALVAGAVFAGQATAEQMAAQADGLKNLVAQFQV